LGKEKCKLMVELLSKRDFNSLIKELLLNYYDPLYQYSENKVSDFKKTIIAYNLHETANDLINYVKNEYDFSV
jgi:tRNA 2-selenouridine synthase